jgi:cytochrome c556
MMGKKQQNLWRIVVLGVGLVLPLAVAWGQSDDAFLQYRQKLMKSLGASMGAIGDTLKNKLPYQNHIATHAKDMQQISTLIEDAFKKEIAYGKTDAKPEIWRDWNNFVSAIKALEQESAKLAEVAPSRNVAATFAQVKKVGGACGGCHKPYRKPKEESFKNR